MRSSHVRSDLRLSTYVYYRVYIESMYSHVTIKHAFLIQRNAFFDKNVDFLMCGACSCVAYQCLHMSFLGGGAAARAFGAPQRRRAAVLAFTMHNGPRIR